jgi:hypothetical protein
MRSERSFLTFACPAPTRAGRRQGQTAIRSEDVSFRSLKEREKRNMSLFYSNDSQHSPSTNNVHRPMGGVEGLREVYDDVSRLTVAAFPFSMVRQIPPSPSPVAACYILADHATAYVGESSNVGRRLCNHAADPAKAFAREVYVVSGFERAWFDKFAAIFLQHRFTVMAEQAGLVDVLKGVNPQVLELPCHRRASLEKFVEHADLLLFDAGCRVLRSNFASQRRAIDMELVTEPLDSTPMHIGVISTPMPGSELELDYVGLWARGYPSGDGFVVKAGSEVRTVVNPSTNPILTTRRNELMDDDALEEIPGVHDRLRLCVAVWFPSAAIAAKVVTGAHVNSGVWVPPRYPRPILITT